MNSQIRDETALGRLMHDFYCKKAEDMRFAVLSDRVKYFKEDEKGVHNMCRAMEELCKKEIHENSISIAIALWKDGITDIERIARLTTLSVEDVKKAIESIKKS